MTDDRRSLDRGDTVGAFRLTDPIGHGGMGRVFAAERVAGGFAQRAAVKLIDAHGRDALRRFQTERQILARLSHPYIVSLQDGGVTDSGQPYLVMEYVEGMPIDAYCAMHQPSLEARLRLCAKVCSAVQYAHSHGVVHRDLKPANILVTPDGAPKVLDFGVAKLQQGDDGGTAATAPGLPGALTANYASPEQLRGLPVSAASDIYSLGVVCHEVLLGARPYELSGLPLDEAIARVLERRSADSAIPVAAVVGQAMSIASEDRYSSAGDLQAALAACADVVAALPAVADHPRVAQRHSRFPWIASAAATVLLAILGYAAWIQFVASPTSQFAEATVEDLDNRARLLTRQVLDSYDPKSASSLIAECITVRRELVRRLPDDLLQQSRLAWALSRRAKLELDLGNRKDARTAATESVAIALALAPLGSGDKSVAALNLHILGLVKRADGQSVAACDDFRRARDLHEASRTGLTPGFKDRFEQLSLDIPRALAGCGDQSPR